MRTILRTPWTVSFVLDWWPYLSLGSILRLRDYEIRYGKGNLRVGQVLKLRMVSPIQGKVHLREVGSDAFTFKEVLKDQVYREVISRVHKCHSVIDLGANIGLSSLYFASLFPSSKIFVVEPNPGTYELLKQNVGELIQKGRCQTLMAAVWGNEQKLVMQQLQGEDHF